jgi:hypothetical protein
MLSSILELPWDESQRMHRIDSSTCNFGQSMARHTMVAELLLHFLVCATVISPRLREDTRMGYISGQKREEEMGSKVQRPIVLFMCLHKKWFDLFN